MVTVTTATVTIAIVTMVTITIATVSIVMIPYVDRFGSSVISIYYNYPPRSANTITVTSHAAFTNIHFLNVD
jgi:hypothetical protein